MVRIKICGITNLEDAMTAVDLGVDALGFVFADSSRRIDPQAAREIIGSLPPFVDKIGVFVNEYNDILKSIFSFCGLSAVQLHGDESSDYLKQCPFPAIKAFRVKDDSILDQIRSFNLSYFLLDTHDPQLAGGTGRRFDWNIAGAATEIGRVILSGGLNQKNIKDALSRVRPYAVDIGSGVEKSPGKKDRNKLAALVHEVKNWNCRIN